MKTLILILLLFPFTLLAQEKWTLEKCIEYAKEHNLEAFRQKLQNKSASEDIRIAKGSYFPDFTLNSFQGFFLGNSFNVSTGVGQLESRFNTFSLTSSVNLFNGLSTRYRLQRARLSSEKGELDLESLYQELSLNITEKYLQILFNKEILIVVQEQEIISKQEVDRLTKLFKAALKPKSDLLEMQSTYALDKKETVIAKNNIENSILTLKAMLDIQEIEDFNVDEIIVSKMEEGNLLNRSEAVINEFIETNPLINSFRINLDISKKDIQIANSNFYPRIDFNYSYGSNYYHVQGTKDLIFNQDTGEFEDNGFWKQLDNNKTHFLGFSATIPVFNRFQSLANLKKAKIGKEISEIELKNRAKELKKELHIAYNDVLTAKATVEATEIGFLSQKEAFSIAQTKYKEGFITSYEFLGSKARYIQTQFELIKAKYDYLLRAKILEYLKG